MPSGSRRDQRPKPAKLTAMAARNRRIIMADNLGRDSRMERRKRARQAMQALPAIASLHDYIRNEVIPVQEAEWPAIPDARPLSMLHPG